MIETGVVDSFTAGGAPVVKLDRDNTRVQVVPSASRTVISSVGGATDPHTHTVVVGVLTVGDRVSVIQGSRGQWFVISVF